MKIYKFVYDDAGYSYKKPSLDGIQLPGRVTTIGRLRKKTKTLVDIAIRWDSNGQISEGIVLPRKALYSMVPIK